MKPLTFNIVYFLAIIVIMGCSGQNGSSPPDQESITQDSVIQAVISFDKLSHDFGTILEGEMVVCYFEYENRGGGDLIVSSVEAGCGCTTPNWDKEPLKPGNKSRLEVIFNASGRSGSR